MLKLEELFTVMHQVFKPGFKLEDVTSIEQTINGMQATLSNGEVWVISFVRAYQN